jgi:ankyrin repeat protein
MYSRTSQKEILGIFCAVETQNIDYFHFYEKSIQKNSHVSILDLTNAAGQSLFLVALKTNASKLIDYLLQRYENEPERLSFFNQDQYLIAAAAKIDKLEVIKRIFPLLSHESLQQALKSDDQGNSIFYGLKPEVKDLLFNIMLEYCSPAVAYSIFSCKSENGRALLHELCAAGGKNSIERMFAIMNQTNHYSSFEDKEKIITDNQEKEIEIEVEKKEGKTINQYELCLELLEQRDLTGKTPLMHAAIAQHIEIVKYILSYLASRPSLLSLRAINIINFADNNKMTALHYVCEKISISKNRKIIALLIEYGANLEAINNKKYSPLSNILGANTLGSKQIANDLMTNGYLIGRNLHEKYLKALMILADQLKRRDRDNPPLFLIGASFGNHIFPHRLYKSELCKSEEAALLITDPIKAIKSFGTLNIATKKNILENCYQALKTLKHDDELMQEKRQKIAAFYYPCLAVYGGLLDEHIEENQSVESRLHGGLANYLGRKFELNKVVPQGFCYIKLADCSQATAYKGIGNSAVKIVPSELVDKFLYFIQQKDIRQAEPTFEVGAPKQVYYKTEYNDALLGDLHSLLKMNNNLRTALIGRSSFTAQTGLTPKLIAFLIP